MTDREKLEAIKDCLVKTCTNEFPAKDQKRLITGEVIDCWFPYNDKQLCLMSEYAYNRGDECFYAEQGKDGKYHPCEPEYVYRLKKDMTIEEYRKIFEE